MLPQRSSSRISSARTSSAEVIRPDCDNRPRAGTDSRAAPPPPFAQAHVCAAGHSGHRVLGECFKRSAVCQTQVVRWFQSSPSKQKVGGSTPKQKLWKISGAPFAMASVCAAGHSGHHVLGACCKKFPCARACVCAAARGDCRVLGICSQ
jgi:hypothetical protein